MTLPPLVVDRECVANSFREWHAEQQLLDAQLAESVAALDAFQSHLDNWQQELARERDELREARDALELERATLVANIDLEAEAGSGKGTEPVGSPSQHDEQSDLDLKQLRDEISALTADLALARAHELELSEALAEQQHQGDTHALHQHDAFDKAVQHAAAANHHDPNGHGRAEPRRGASPVLGSVMEQFGKLREQRSLSRSNTKPR